MVRLQRNGGNCDFYSLFEEGDTGELVITFLSLLELMKRHDVIVKQNYNFDRLTVSFGRKEDSNGSA